MITLNVDITAEYMATSTHS